MNVIKTKIVERVIR